MGFGFRFGSQRGVGKGGGFHISVMCMTPFAAPPPPWNGSFDFVSVEAGIECSFVYICLKNAKNTHTRTANKQQAFRFYVHPSLGSIFEHGFFVFLGFFVYSFFLIQSKPKTSNNGTFFLCSKESHSVSFIPNKSQTLLLA